jgi:hypothetical protein
MKIPATLALLSFLFISGCDNSKKEKEPPEKEKISEVKKDSAEKEDEIDIEAASVKADDYYQNDTLSETGQEKIVGCWFVPHSATINIRFSQNGEFEFNDYNDQLEKSELLTGKFRLSDKTLILFYSDRPKQKFSFTRGKGADDNYYIKNSSGYYFVKGVCE